MAFASFGSATSMADRAFAENQRNTRMASTDKQDKAEQAGLVYANGGYFEPGAYTGRGGGLTEQGLNQRLASETTLQATQQTAAAAGSTAAPGQDIFSQKLAGMAQGQFSPDDPSYQWRLQQGEQALERSQAARGNLGSGNILTAITDYAQGAASQEYGAQFQRMLQGSQNATAQYGQAYNTLAQMLGQGTGIGNMLTGQASEGVRGQAQNFAQKYATNQSQGATDVLARMMNTGGPAQLTGAAYWANQDALEARQASMEQQNSSTLMSGYSTGGYASYGEPAQGSGWFTSSSGGSGTFGDTSSAGGFGGGE